MTNDIATRDDRKQVERWENEGGRVSPLNNNETQEQSDHEFF